MNEEDSKLAAAVIPDTEPAPADEHAWARGFASSGVFVMHLPTRTIGKVKVFYDGVDAHYTPPGAKEPTKGPVLELESGHSFVAKASEAFLPLTQREASYYLAVQAILRDVLKEATKLAGAQKIAAPSALTLAACALREAAAELDRGLKRLREAPLAEPPSAT